MIRIIDRYQGQVIQKLTKPNGDLVCYQTKPEATIGTSEGTVRHPNLLSARKYLGIPMPKSLDESIPKAHCIQNQKGYRADNQRKSKGS